MIVSDLLLYLLFQDLLRPRVDLPKHLARLFTPLRVQLDSHKTCDLLFLRYLNPSRPNHLHLTRIFSLLSFLNLVAILYRLWNLLVGFLCRSSIVLHRSEMRTLG